MVNMVVVLRHGEYLGDRMTNDGRRETESTSKKLRAFITEKPIILSSTAIRALQSAAIIAEEFDTAIEPYSILLSDSNHPTDIDCIYQLLSKRKGTVIIVTHLEYMTDIPYCVAEWIMGIDAPKKFKEMPTSSAIVINCVEKTFEYIYP